MIKLLIVDDSALMRRLLSSLFQAEGEFEIRVARSGVEAVADNLTFQPDVVTLDINMPEMDGLTALSLMMAARPVPVVMVSSLTARGALATFEALNLGAVDFVAKPGGTISLSMESVRLDLIAKVRAAVRARISPNIAKQVAAPGAPSASPLRGLTQRLRSEREAAELSASQQRPIGREGVLLIGVSTGGPRALELLLPAFPANFPWPIVVAQHMPASFTQALAARINGLCALDIVEVSQPTALKAGCVYIGRGGADMVLTRRSDTLTIVPRPASPEHLWHPSAELLARSALTHCAPSNLVALMLTGMGSDGADAFTEIHRRGGRTIAESQDTAVVFGMPAELIARGGASLVLPLDKIALQVKAWAAR